MNILMFFSYLCLSPYLYGTLIPNFLCQLEQEGRIYLARSVDGIVYSLWSLLPSFCNYPMDTAESFKDLGKALISALRDEPDVRGIICSSLQILIQQNKSILEPEDEISITERSSSEERAIAHYDSQVAADNLSVLKSSARALLSVLSEVFFKSSKDTSGALQVLPEAFRIP